MCGTGQGSGNSPTHWMFISSTLFDCHSLKAHGAQFSSPDGSISVTLCMLGFVDDTSNRTNFFEHQVQPTIDEIVRLMQHDTQAWSDLLHASGGELELPKCTYHHIRCTFDKKGRPTMKPGLFGPNLAVTNPRGEDIIIKQLPVSESHKLLGCYKDPEGGQKKQCDIAKRNCQELAKVVNNSTLDRHESLIFYRHIYVPSATHPLFCTFFAEQQIHDIQSNALQSLTRSCGCNQSTPELLLVGPSLCGCPSFTHLFDSQSLCQVQMFLKHWRSHRNPGQVLRVAMAWWQFVAGISGPLLEYPDVNLPHFEAESKYIASLRRCLSSMGASVEVDDPGVPALQREHDVCTMEEVLASGRFNTTEIKCVNLCRLCLQVVTLSDITTASGKKLDLSIKAGTPSLLAPTSRWLKCHQERPRCKCVWKAWTKACGLFANCKGKLKQPLGKWLVTPDEFRCQWRACYVPLTDHLHIRCQDHFRIHQLSTHLYSYDFYSPCYVLPPDAAPADISYKEEGIKLRCYSLRKPVPDHAEPDNFDTYLSTLPNWEQRLFFGLEWLKDPLTPQEAILEGSLVIVSDGSAPDKASFGWTMATADGTRLVSCYGPTWGHSPSSCRAEGHGTLSATCFLSRVIKHYHLIVHSHPKEHCDNKGLLKNIHTCSLYHGNHCPNDSLSADWDVIIEVLAARNSLSKAPSLHHVKGHQDKDKDYASPSLQAQLNVDADALAAECMHHHCGQHLKAPLTSHAKALFHLPTGTVTNKLKRELLQAKRGPPALAHVSSANNWTQEVTQSIDWDTHGSSFGGFPHPTAIFKFLHDLLPEGYRANKNDPKYSPNCPDCDCKNETIVHFYHCPSMARYKSKVVTLQKHNKHAIKKNTDPILLEIMMQGLESFFFNKLEPDPWRHPIQCRPLISEQNKIGWKNFLKGRWSGQWRRLQQHHYSKCPTPPNLYSKKSPPDDPKQWSINPIKTLWDLWFEDMWTVRNKSRHGHDQDTRRQATREHTLYELDQLYALQPSTPTRLQFIFTTPLHVLKEKKTHHLQNWMSTWKPLIASDSA